MGLSPYGGRSTVIIISPIVSRTMVLPFSLRTVIDMPFAPFCPGCPAVVAFGPRLATAGFSAFGPQKFDYDPGCFKLPERMRCVIIAFSLRFSDNYLTAQ